VKWGRIDLNPVRETALPTVPRTRHVRPWTPSHVEALRHAMLVDDRLMDATLVSVLAYAGVRPQEARGLTWGDIGQRTMRIARAVAGRDVKPTKTTRLRTVRLVLALRDDLARWFEACGKPGLEAPVFATRRGGVWADTDWRNWRARVYEPYAATVGITGPPYDLRHSFASLLIYEGRPVVEVAAQLGDSTETTLKHYVHVFEEYAESDRLAAQEAIDAARAEFNVRGEYAEPEDATGADTAEVASTLEADARTRTGDPIITSDVLYQLSYVGGERQSTGPERAARGLGPTAEDIADGAA